MKSLLSAIIISTLTFNIYAKDNSFGVTIEKYRSTPKGSEYISGTTYHNRLMKIKLMGEVKKPGLHIVPENSDFTTLLSYAGGPTKDADISQIEIKRKYKKGYKNIKLDFKNFLESNSKDLKLKSNDLIYVHKEEDFFSSKKLSIVATILGIVVSAIVIEDRL